MNALNQAAKLPNIRIDPWLKLYPPRSPDAFLERFKGANVHIRAPNEERERTERIVRESYDRDAEFAVTVGHVLARDLGIQDETPYARAAGMISKAVKAESIKRCQPWEAIMAAIILAENKAIYVPDDCDIVCLANYAKIGGNDMLVIESEHGWYWLHRFEIESSSSNIKPDDWILLRC